jgi:hypothetical protein
MQCHDNGHTHQENTNSPCNMLHGKDHGKNNPIVHHATFWLGCLRRLEFPPHTQAPCPVMDQRRELVAADAGRGQGHQQMSAQQQLLPMAGLIEMQRYRTSVRPGILESRTQKQPRTHDAFQRDKKIKHTTMRVRNAPFNSISR